MKATFIITLILAVSFATCEGSFTKFFSHIKDKIKHHLHDHLWGVKHDHSSGGHHHTGQKEDVDETHYYTGKHVDPTKPPVVHEVSTSTVEFTDSPTIAKIAPTADGFPNQKEIPDQTQDESNNEQEILPDETIIDEDVIDPTTKYAVTEDDVITVATDNEDKDPQQRGDNDVKDKSSEDIDDDSSAENEDNASNNASQEYDESDKSFEEESDEKNTKADSSDMNSDDDYESEQMSSSLESDNEASDSSHKHNSEHSDSSQQKDSSESSDSPQEKHSSESSDSSQEKHSSESSDSSQDEDSVDDVSKDENPTSSGKMSSEEVDQVENSQEFPDQTKIIDEDIFPGKTTTDDDDVFPGQTSQSVDDIDENDIPDQTIINKDEGKDDDNANPCQDVICPNGMMCMNKELQCRYRSCPMVATCQALRPLSNFCGTPKKHPRKKCINNNMWFYNSAHGRCEKFVYSGCGYDPNVYSTEYVCQNSCINKAACQLAKEKGPCRAAFPKWYYDVSDAKCKLFVYGGCAGNENRFDNSDECSAICVDDN